MNWFRKKKEPEVIHHMYDILPSFDWETATSETAKEFFKGLSRIQMIEIYDRDMIPEHLHDEFFEVDNEIKYWPIDHNVSEALNKLYWNSDSLYKNNRELLKKIDGMQKKLDRLAKLIENTEITMSGKTALDM